MLINTKCYTSLLFYLPILKVQPVQYFRIIYIQQPSRIYTHPIPYTIYSIKLTYFHQHKPQNATYTIPFNYTYTYTLTLHHKQPQQKRQQQQKQKQ